MVVSSPTKRFYVVVGSYADVAGAKKAALKYRGIGYAQAKVVQGGGRIRVSLNDFAQKAEASALAAKAGKDFPGAWVFAY
jgi:cell division protein FtsN